jgi:short-subunit dehydrogenase
MTRTTDPRIALVTGASSGIGEAFARRLAADGHDLVLVARSEDRLTRLAAELERRHGRSVLVVPADLSTPDGVASVRRRTDAAGIAVDLLVNNAGFATHGALVGLDPARDHQQVMVDVAAVVGLTHAYAPGMVARGRGGIVNVASTAGFQPLPFMAVYGASKAFVLSFTEALRVELAGTGVTVVALCPGPTETAFFSGVGDEASVGGRRATPEEVVDAGARALARDAGTVVVGFRHRLLTALPRVLPRSVTAAVSGRILRREEDRPAASRRLTPTR